MSADTKIPVPPELRAEIVECKSAVDRAVAEFNAAAAAKDGEIAELNASLVELDERITQLSRQAIHSDSSTSELLLVERRKRAIVERRAELAAASGVPLPSLLPCASVCMSIYFHWIDAVPKKIAEAVKPFGFPIHIGPQIFAHTQAMSVLRGIADFTAQFQDATPGNVARLFSYFDRALRGQVNLAVDEPPDETKPISAAPSNAA